MSLIACSGALSNYVLLLLRLKLTNQTIYQPFYQSTNQKPAVAHSLVHAVSNYAIFLLVLLQDTYLPTNQSINQPTNHPTNQVTNLQPKVSSCLNHCLLTNTYSLILHYRCIKIKQLKIYSLYNLPVYSI